MPYANNTVQNKDEAEVKLAFADIKDRIDTYLRKEEFESQLSTLLDTVTDSIQKRGTAGNFNLTEFELNIGVKGNILVIGLEGGITLHFRRINGAAKN
jgi:hypothetical protein